MGRISGLVPVALARWRRKDGRPQQAASQWFVANDTARVKTR